MEGKTVQLAQVSSRYVAKPAKICTFHLKSQTSGFYLTGNSPSKPVDPFLPRCGKLGIRKQDSMITKQMPAAPAAVLKSFGTFLSHNMRLAIGRCALNSRNDRHMQA
eukprot:6197206-Pleurochrysis_carterae.AAC.2